VEDRFLAPTPRESFFLSRFDFLIFSIAAVLVCPFIVILLVKR
jgi:hypothetical protein